MKIWTTRRASVAAAGLTIAALALTGCSSDGAADSGSADGTLTLWQRDGGVDLTEQVAAYEDANPGVEVKVSTIQADQYLTKLANSARAGSVPDLVSFDIVNTPLLSTQGLLADISDNVDALSNKGDLAPAGVEIGTLDGKNYGLPVALTGSQMFWNKDLFTRAGLDPEAPPTSLAEVKVAAEKISALGDEITGFSTLAGVGQAWTGFPSAWANGGSVLTEPGPDQKAAFTSPELEGMVTWYQDMWESGLMQKTDQPNQDPGNVGQENALNGNVGIIFTGANTLTAKKDQFGSGIGIPGVEGGSGSFLGGDEIGITAGAKNPDEAWDLMEWLLSSEEAAEITLSQGWIAPDLVIAESLATDKWSQDIVASLGIGQLPKSIAYNAVINDPNGPWAQQSQKVIFEGADASIALADAQEQANGLIEQAYSQVGQ
ncbi:sugar ABC transporter substrate-binding protein [Microbacterium sp. M28]|uniref:ABC transporter substrate-binding protein n=1 Tax=Microbacterium sp. M28 TaxID=2962064 RepID=UPI0021F4944A|nr:sugar ABC transporter substrate-binding protein [Microbacterium sp. M28]UYO95782.1 sugar ABC transporter substrate-binding protein [Microbacterium sp. M28]